MNENEFWYIFVSQAFGFLLVGSDRASHFSFPSVPTRRLTNLSHCLLTLEQSAINKQIRTILLALGGQSKVSTRCISI